MAETPLKRGLAVPYLEGIRSRVRASRLAWPVALALVVLAGGALRFHGLGWDQPDGADAPLQMHPDERFMSLVADRIDWPDSIGGYFDTADSPLNPYNAPDTPSFVYGTFPLFLAKGVSTIAGDDHAGPGDGYDHTVVWGRRLTALFDTATIALAFALGAALFGRRTGLVAALFYALAVLPTQLAHFWTTDPYLVFFGVAALLFMVLFARSEGTRAPWAYGIAAGVCLGFATACKVNALTLLPVLGIAVLLRIGLRDVPRLGLLWGARGSQRVRRAGHWMTDIAILCVAIAAGIVVFRIAQPYAFNGPHFWDMGLSDRWLDDIQRERNFQDGNVDYPPFVQFAGRTPVLRPLEQMVLWGLGPALGVAASIAVGFATVFVFKRRDLRFVLPLAVIAGVMAFQGPRFVAFMRYFAPMYPALLVLAAWGVVAAWGWLRTAPGWPSWHVRWRLRTPAVPAAVVRRAGFAAIGAVFLATAWWALAFQNVYREEHPRIAASEWIYENVPPGSSITGEFWDDTVPYALPGENPGLYRIINTEPYEPDSVEKVYELVYGRPGDSLRAGLDGADYVAITSDRIRASVPRLEREYPATIRYYQLLESGELGFDKVAEFSVHPSFLGISVDDSSAEESFTVYDHPHVTIYKKSADWDPQRALTLLLEAHPERAVNLLPRQGRTNGLQFTPEEAEVQQEGGTFSSIFDADGLASHVPWAWWLAWVELAAFATVPVLTWVFRALPDRGYGLSKLAGISTVALVTWLAVAWGGPHFSARLVWVVYGAVVAAGAATAWWWRATLREEWRERRGSWLAIEAVFLAAFAFFLLLRYYNPDLWYHPQGGEKPVELAYLTAVAKSSTMPPYDPWFSGGAMNYYYMGWFIVAVPIRALRLLPEVGFNLAIPTYAGLGATVAFSTVHNLVALTPIRRRGRRLVTVAHPRWRAAIAAGVLGMLLLLFAGNLDSLHQTVERLQAINTWGGPWGTGGSGAWDIPVIGEPLRLLVRMVAGGIGVAGGLWQWAVHGTALPPFDWWRASRVHPPAFDITEFPYWSLLFADLHPHLMGVSFFGLVIAIAVAYVFSAVGALRAQTWALAVVLGFALGLVRTVHTWDFPTAVLLGSAGIVAGQLLAEGRWQQRWWNALAHLAVAAGVLVVAFAPYTARFEVFQQGLVRARETTPANQQVAQFGVFFAFAAAFLVLRHYEELAARRFRPGSNVGLALVAGWWELGALAVFLTGLTAFTWRFGLATVALSAVAIVFFANLLWLEYRARERNIPRLLVTGMFVAAIGISAGVDVVNVKNDIVRMNTVFKFGLQAWQLFALASAYAGWYVSRALWAVRSWWPAPRAGRKLPAYAGAALAAFLLFSASIYLWSGTKARQEARFAATGPTLDGLAYMNRATYYEDAGTPDPGDDGLIRLKDDKALIDWLRDNVKGSPIIAEAVGPLYHWTGRISVNTGLPSVIGWDWHEIAYRMDYAGLVQQRRLDTTVFYRAADEESAREYIRKYNVSYIVVGTEERIHGTTEGLWRLQHMDGLTEVFRSGPYAIYEVDPALRDSPAPVQQLLEGPPKPP